MNKDIKLIMKASANNTYDKVLIAFKNNKELRSKYPSLDEEIRFVRDNHYKLIDGIKGNLYYSLTAEKEIAEVEEWIKKDKK